MLRLPPFLQRPARWWWLALASLPVACNSLWGIDELSYDQATGGATSTGGESAGGGTPTGGAGGSGGAAGATTGGSGGQGGTPCDLGPFGEPVVLTEVNSADGDWDPCLSPDELTIYLVSSRPGSLGEADIWVATRPDGQSLFEAPQNLAAVNSAQWDMDPEISVDGLTLYLAVEPVAGAGDLDLYAASRPTVAADFGSPQILAGVNGAYLDRDPTVSPDQLTIVFASNRSGGAGELDLWYATRPTVSADFGSPINLASVNSALSDCNPALSSDGLELYFSWGSGASTEIWRAARPDVGAAFEAPETVPELNTVSGNSDPFLSADRRTIYFSSRRSGGEGGGAIWYATRDCE